MSVLLTLILTILGFLVIFGILYGISAMRGAIMAWENRRTPIDYRYPR